MATSLDIRLKVLAALDRGESIASIADRLEIAAEGDDGLAGSLV